MKIARVLFIVLMAFALSIGASSMLGDNTIMGDVRSSGFRGEILFQENFVYNAEKGNLFRSFDTDFFSYPWGENLSFALANSFHLFFYLPLRTLLDPVECYNALLGFLMILNFLSAYLLSVHVLKSKPAAVFSSLIFALNPYILLKLHLGFLQKIAVFWIPLYIFMLLRLYEERSLKFLLVSVLTLCAMQLFYPPYAFYAIILTLILSLYSIGSQKEAVFAFSNLVAIAILLILCTSLLYFIMGLGIPYPKLYSRGIGATSRMSFDITSPFRFLPFPKGYFTSGLPLGISFMALALAVVGWVRERGLPRFLLAVFILFIILAAGPWLISGGKPVLLCGKRILMPFYLLANYIPYAWGIKFPVRLLPFVNVCLGLSAGYGLKNLCAPGRKRLLWGILALAAALYVLETSMLYPEIFPVRVNTFRIPKVYEEVAKSDCNAIINLPIPEYELEYRRAINLYGLFAALSKKRMVNSYQKKNDFIFLLKNRDTAEEMKKLLRMLAAHRVGYILVHEDFLGTYKKDTFYRQLSWLEEYCETAYYPADRIFVYLVPEFKELTEEDAVLVPDDAVSINEAIKNVREGQTILVRPGHYFENVGFFGKAVVLKSMTGPFFTTIDGGKKKSTVTFMSAEDKNSVIDGFRITGGNGTPLPCHLPTREIKTNGGGICCVKSSPVIRNNIIEGNEAENGGGICCVDHSSPLIVKNRVIYNKAEKGGGIRCSLYSSPKIEKNDISNNEAHILGGGIYWRAGSYPLLENNIIKYNKAGYKGGGIYGSSFGDKPNGREIFIRGCTIQNNEAQNGNSMAFGTAFPKIKLESTSYGGPENVYDPRGAITE